MIRVPLTRGLFAVIDDEDADAVLYHKWHAFRAREAGSFYAVTRTQGKTKGKSVYMHRLIMNPASGAEVDHVNGDGLCNLRSNLRIVTSRQNRQNMRSYLNSTSRFKGVSRADYCNGWQAQAGHKHIGSFKSEVDAAFAYDMEALDAFGEFARPNFIESVELYREIRRLPHPGTVCFGSMKGLE